MNLKTGLQNVIEFVESLPNDTYFEMNSYSDCVIGQMNNGDGSWSRTQATTLNKMFGLNLEDENDLGWTIYYLNQNELDSIDTIDQDTKTVIELFTTKPFTFLDQYADYEGASCVSKSQWLSQAKPVLESLK